MAPALDHVAEIKIPQNAVLCCVSMGGILVKTYTTVVTCFDLFFPSPYLNSFTSSYSFTDIHRFMVFAVGHCEREYCDSPQPLLTTTHFNIQTLFSEQICHYHSWEDPMIRMSPAEDLEKPDNSYPLDH